MVDPKRLANLLLKKLENDLSPIEEREVETWLSQGNNRVFFEKEITSKVLYGWLKERMEMDEKSMDERFYALLNRKAPVKQLVSKRQWMAAASVLFFLAMGAAIFYRTSAPSPFRVEQQKQMAAVIHPGSSRAHLQLANGAIIELDTAKNGSIALQGASSIVKNGSTISYSSSDGAALTDAYNILATPRAGQFQMVLPDGTKVWLNNASSLKYPVNFSGNQRRVELKGEAYFEVAKIAGKPFYVDIPKASVEVLGTGFNVSAYDDEQFQKTTLVEGKIRVTASNDNLVLTPGEQAEGSDGNLTVRHPDIYSVTAWRKGFFNFSDADIQTVMRQIARWYDVEIKYEGEPSKEKLEGSISRNQNLTETLAALDALHIHAIVNNRIVTVYP